MRPTRAPFPAIVDHCKQEKRDGESYLEAAGRTLCVPDRLRHRRRGRRAAAIVASTPSAHVHAVPMATLPPYEIVALMRSIGLRPLHRPVREGPTYAMRAVDPIGEEVRVVVDARSGRILRIEPVLIPPNALPVVPAPYGRPSGRIVMLPDGPTGRIAELPPGGPPGHPASIARPAAGAPAASGPQGSVPPLPRPRPKVAATQSPAKPVRSAVSGAGCRSVDCGTGANGGSAFRLQPGESERDAGNRGEGGEHRHSGGADSAVNCGRAARVRPARAQWRTNESAPESGALPPMHSIETTAYAALASTTWGWPPPIGIWRGFLASGISRTRSTCRRPFSRAAPLTWTCSASWKTRSKVRAAMPW